MNVTLPNGAVIQGVPEGTPKDEIKRKAIMAGLATEADFPAPQFGSQDYAEQAVAGLGEVPARPDAPAQPQEELSALDQVVGAGETALALGTGATGGLAGQLGGAITGLIGEIVSGNYGEQEAADRIEAFSNEMAKRFTYDPRGQAGKEQTKAVAETLAPLSAVPPLAELQALSAASGFAVPQVAKAASELPKRVRSRAQRFTKPPAERNRAMGADEVLKETQRSTIAESMPVPFEGESALTKGQATRNFEQLQFEKETAKLGDVGAPLRDRVENQTNTLIANLDAISDLSNPARSEVRDIGRAVDEALTNRHKNLKRQESRLYEAAEKSGEMRERVEISDAARMFDALEEMEDVASNAGAIKKNAIKRGIITEVEDGIVAQPKTLAELERFRQFVNDSTDITDPRQARVRRLALSSIDEATENAGGDAYKKARQFSSKMRQEFENVGLTKKLLSEKRGTSERQIAYEDVFKKVMLDSPIEEINKLRSTLLKSGKEGKQAWSDLKAKGIEYIKDNSMSASQRSEGGTPLLSPDRLNKAIKIMDEKGKLDAIYGKRSAQAIRDLGELANDIYTAPPGAVNFSNTASALQVAMDSLGGFAATGLPVPVVTTLRAAAKALKDSKKKKRIQDSLTYLSKKRQN